MSCLKVQAANVDRDRFCRDGYLHLKAIFSPAEISEFRDKLIYKESFATFEQPTGDLLSNPITAEFIQDGRLIEVTRKLLGAQPVYFGDSSYVVYDENHAVCSFHKDNADRHDPNGPDWCGEYPILRFGLYLQDHSRCGGGLVVRAGSHRSLQKNRKLEVLNEEVLGWLNGRTRYVPTEIGDVVVWNLRTTHAGMGRYIRGPLKRPISERMQKFFPEYLHSRAVGQRIAMFASFGLAGTHLERYLNNLRMRSYMVKVWQNSVYAKQNFEAFSGHDATLLDMRNVIESEILSGKTIGQNARWEPLPY